MQTTNLTIKIPITHFPLIAQNHLDYICRKRRTYLRSYSHLHTGTWTNMIHCTHNKSINSVFG